MAKAFIFDFDGVIVNNEQIWLEREKEFLPRLVGTEIYLKFGLTTGLGVDVLYKKAVEYGSTVTRLKFMQVFSGQAKIIYNLAPLTPGLEFLVDSLIKLNFSIGIVSASPREWIDLAINRLSFKDKIQVIVTLHDRLDLAPKPAPDGYLEVMKQFNVKPQNTIILEDSNTGIASAKASGAFTIGFKQNLTKDYIQKGADIYAENSTDIEKIAQDFCQKL